MKEVQVDPDIILRCAKSPPNLICRLIVRSKMI